MDNGYKRRDYSKGEGHMKLKQTAGYKTVLVYITFCHYFLNCPKINDSKRK
jgi:hypothetical protein